LIGLICHDTKADQILEWDDDVDVDDDAAAALVVVVVVAMTRPPVHIKIDPANKRVKESSRRRPATLDDPFVDDEDSWWCDRISGFCICASLLQRLVVHFVIVQGEDSRVTDKEKGLGT
jgi:hypothetical protein